MGDGSESQGWGTAWVLGALRAGVGGKSGNNKGGFCTVQVAGGDESGAGDKRGGWGLQGCGGSGGLGNGRGRVYRV